MPLSDAAKDILTLGAHSRVEDKRAELADLRLKLSAALAERDVAIGEANSAIEQLVVAKSSAVDILRGISKISKHIQAAERNLTEHQLAALPAPVLPRVEAILSEAEIAGHAKAGMMTGASLALGTWALAGTAGMTTAGAALSASTAAFAGVGAGAIAAGGAAAGALALGSLVLLPAAAILAIFSHNSADKKIREIETEVGKALAALEESRGALLAVQNLQRRAREVSHAIEKAAAVFEGEKQKCLKRLYPLGIISRALKNIRKFLGGNYFSKRDLERLLPLINMARILADLIDRRILDEKGNVV
ncbi:MAG: hypothetical protein KF713_04675 [Turneriella sp.]|nr:hypothetical protein [Turneriella sp.]